MIPFPKPKQIEPLTMPEIPTVESCDTFSGLYDRWLHASEEAARFAPGSPGRAFWAGAADAIVARIRALFGPIEFPRLPA